MTKLPSSPAALSQKDKEAEFENLKRRIHGKLVDKLDLSRIGELEGDVLRREIRLVVEHLCNTEDTYLNRSERDRLIEEVLDETFGLGPLEMLLKEPTISEIMINGPKNVYVERSGTLEKAQISSATTSICCRSSTASFRASAAASTKSARWPTPACPTVRA